jgi:hypothetical protein
MTRISVSSSGSECRESRSQNAENCTSRWWSQQTNLALPSARCNVQCRSAVCSSITCQAQLSRPRRIDRLPQPTLRVQTCRNVAAACLEFVSCHCDRTAMFSGHSEWRQNYHIVHHGLTGCTWDACQNAHHGRAVHNSIAVSDIIV